MILDLAGFRAALPGGGRLAGLAVGAKTIEGAAKAGLAGIAVIAGHTISADSQAMIEAADRAGLIAADASRARRAELVDKLAASYILQGAIDALASGISDA